MKKVLHSMQSLIVGASFTLLAIFGLNSTAYSQVDVTASAGTLSGSYTTLKDAFDAINSGTHQGTITIGLSASTTETASAVLNSNGAGSALYASVLIQPTVDGVSISGATAAGRGVIELKGADNVTINGDNPNTGGTNRNLTITNTAASTVAYTSVIRIATATAVTSADDISILNCVINGNATGRNDSANTSSGGSENTTFGIFAGGDGGATAVDDPAALTTVPGTAIPTAVTINNFIVSNNAVNAAARGIVFLGSEEANSNSVSITGNLVGDQATTLTGAAPYTSPATTVYIKGISVQGTTSVAVTGNTVKNIVSYFAGAVAGIELGSAIGSGTITVSNNTVDGVVVNATGSTTYTRGIGIGSAAGPYTLSNNTVRNVQNGNSSTVDAARPCGMYVSTSAASATISGNSVSKINCFNSNTYGVTAVALAGGDNITVQNNVIYDVNEDISGGVAFSTQYGINGLRVSSGTGHKIYHNTISLSGAMGGSPASSILSAAFMITSTSQTGMDVRNNIFSNTMTGGTTSIACVAICLPSGATGSMNLTLNNNAYYSGTTAASQGIAQVGTSAGTGFYLASNFVAGSSVGATNLRTYTNALSAAGTNDNASIASTAAAPFASATDLHISAGVMPTQLESGGASVGVATDMDGDTRPGPAGSVNGGATAPDMGADEFDGVPLTTPVVTLSSVTPPLAPQCTAAGRVITVNVANSSGTIVSVNLGYTVNGAAQSPIAMTNVSGTSWQGTIPVPSPADATIAWGVAATNSFALTGTYTGTAYADAPATGVVATASSSASPICEGESSSVSAAIVKPGTVTLGSGSSSSSNSPAVTPFYGGYGGVKTQYLIRATELTAAGLSAGDITSLSMTLVSAGSALDGFAISAENTSINALTGTIETVTNQVYAAATYTPAMGVNTFPFSAPLSWDGTSNIILSFCWSNENTSNTVSNVLIATTTFASGNARYADSRTAAEICGYTGSATPPTWNGSSTSVSSRPIFMLAGNQAVTSSSISWSDGSTVVGTTTPLSVSPLTTTTYTATIEVGGCAIASSPSTTVTVNPLPTAPTATNSAQCGVQVPTASVASTTGAPTPTFSWYSASTGGSPLLSGTSTTYTSAISSTTTFYVSEVSAAGCESTRTAVTVTVSTPDAVAADALPTTLCLGGSVTLTGSNTNGTPVQTYTYSWSGDAGSGAETPTAGASVSVTPTAAGTYTYTLTATDGGCTAINSVSVTVNPVPTSLVADATDTEICNGSSIDLTATVTTNSLIVPGTPLAQDFDSGMGAWTVSSGAASPAASNWQINTAPFSYNGFADFTDFSTTQGGGFALSNSDAGGSGSVTDTRLVSPVFSTAGYTSATLTFENLYRKVGSSSDISGLLEISTDGGTTWDTLVDYQALGNQGDVTNNGQLTNNESIVFGAAYLNQPNLRLRFNYGSAWGYFWLVDNIQVSGLQEGTTTYDWTSTPAGFTSSDQHPVGVMPTATTTYDVNVTNSFGCSASGSVTVTVNQPTAATVSATDCNAYTLNGTTYTVSGTYTQMLTNAAGCDSTLTLNLTLNSSFDTITETACGSYTLNGTTYNSTGSFVQTLTNMSGCDSTITLNLTVLEPTTASVSVSDCESYTVNGQTYTATGSYTQTLTNAAGCDSTLTVNVTITGLTGVTATDNGDHTITATAGASYQWIHCATGLAISGATSQTYTATVNGNYAVIVTNASGCSDTSNCVTVANIGIDELSDATIHVFPNPTHTDVTVTMSAPNATIEVVDAQGKVLQSLMVVNGEKVDLSRYETGVYFLRISTENGSAMERVIKN